VTSQARRIISLIGCNEFDSGGCSDLDHGQALVWYVAKCCQNGTAERIRNIDRDTLTVEGVDPGVDGSFTAVCHGHSESGARTNFTGLELVVARQPARRRHYPRQGCPSCLGSLRRRSRCAG
jgi:hypothetical protein